MPPFVVDNSMLSALFTCTTKAWVRYGQHLTTTDQRAELLSGQAGHAALAMYHTTGDRIRALMAYDDLYRAWGSSNVDPNERLSYHNTYTILKQFLQNHPIHNGVHDRSWMYQPITGLVEVPFEVALDDHGDFLFIGRIDVVGQYNQHYIVNENKFTGRIAEDWKRTFRNDSQLSGYFYGCKYGLVGGQSLNLPIMGGFVTAIQLSKLPSDPVRRCKDHGVKYSECSVQHAKWEIFGPLPREESMIHSWRADALAGAKRLKAIFEEAPNLSDVNRIAQEGTFTRACRWCELQAVCETGRQPHGLLGKLIVSKWDPRTRTEVAV